MDESLRAKLDADIAWTRQQLESLSRDWRRLPYLALLMVLAVPLGFALGGFGVFLGLVAPIVLAAISAYIIHGHRTDYEDRLTALERQRRTSS